MKRKLADEILQANLGMYGTTAGDARVKRLQTIANNIGKPPASKEQDSPSKTRIM